MPVSGAAQQQKIRQMVHTSWTGRSGAPQGITALAQTLNGQLWLGTVAGLYSFDGYHFKSFPLPLSLGKPIISRKVQSLFVARDGGLWVVGMSRGAVYLKGSVVEDAGLFQGEHARFDSLQEDSSGRIWAVLNDHTLAWCAGDHVWHGVPGPLEHPTLISGIYFDSRGTLWVVDDDHLYRRAPGGVAFQKTAITAEGGIHFAETPDGTLWIVGQTPKRYKGEIHGVDLRHFDLDGRLIPFPFVHSDVNALLVSHQSALWVLENDIGKYGERTPGLTRHDWRGKAWQTDHITSAQGLGDSDSHAMIEDADGSIWVGGERQLERFRPSALVPLTPGLVGSSWVMCANPQGGLWVGSRSGILMHKVGGKEIEVHGQDGPYKLLCREDGSAWMLDARGVSLVEGTSVHRLPLLAGHGSYLDNWGFSDILETSDHRLIVAEHGAKESRLWKFSRGRWIPFFPNLTAVPLHASYEDLAGRLYFGGLDDTIFAIEGKRARRIPVLNDAVGTVSSFKPFDQSLLVMGSEGIAVLEGGAFKRLRFVNPEQAEMASGIVQAPGGDVWINGERGIVRVAAAEMHEALNNPEHPIVGSEIHEGDFVGPAVSGITSSSAVRDSTGTLWFSTLNGVVSLNPAALHMPVTPPELRIESADADDRPFADHASLPPHVATVRIRYLGLSLTRPKDVIYSYKLEGADREWQTVGPRTEAVYTSLKPSAYRFLVKASYGDNAWTQPVPLNLEVLPAFYQTWWFRSLCLLFCLSLAAGSVLMRLRFLASALRERAEQRADERIRIARDLHDTLLQGVQGLMLTFHVAAKSVPEGGETQRLLERALQSADRLLVEGRNRVSNLRGDHPADRVDLLVSLKRVGEELNIQGQRAFLANSNGKPILIKPAVIAELFLVGREALTNAFRHSNAMTIEISLQYAPKSLTMICRDNGRGIASDRNASHNNRWGIRGMVERVERLGGICWIEGSPSAGTVVTASLPAGRVYVDAEHKSGFRLRLFRHRRP